MLHVSLATLVSVVLVLLFIIFFLLIAKSKPNQHQVNEMKETGWEIVNQIQLYLDKLEEQKQEMEQTLTEMKKIEHAITQRNDQSTVKEQSVQGKKESLVALAQVSQQKRQIVDLYHQGYASEEITEQLRIQKGIVEVVLNMEKMKKNA